MLSNSRGVRLDTRLSGARSPPSVLRTSLTVSSPCEHVRVFPEEGDERAFLFGRQASAYGVTPQGLESQKGRNMICTFA